MPWRIDIGIEKKPPLLWGDYVDLFPEYFLENNKIDLDVVRVLKWLNKSMGSSGNTGWIVDVVCTKFSTVEELLEHVLFEKYEHFPDPVAKYRDLAPSLNIFRQALVNYFLQKGTV